MADHGNYQVATYIQIETTWEMKINIKKRKRKGSRTKSTHIMNWLSDAFSFGESITVELKEKSKISYGVPSWIPIVVISFAFMKNVSPCFN